MELYLVGLLTSLLAAPPTVDDRALHPMVPGFDRLIRQRVLTPQMGGRLLLSELSCTACHADSRSELKPKRGPRLGGVTRRYHADWLRRFLLDPAAVKPGTTMPGMLSSLSDPERTTATRALVAFLSTLNEEQSVAVRSSASAPVATEFWRKGDQRRGERLFHRVGCIACHEPDSVYRGEKTYLSDRAKRLAELKLDPEEREALQAVDATQPFRSVPLVELSAKYDLRSLCYFLLDPLTVRPAGRMPDMKLEPAEAADLSAYLMNGQATVVAAVEPVGAELVARGRRWFSDLGCVHCHPQRGMSGRPARQLDRLAGDAPHSCLVSPQRGFPEFPLDRLQRRALQQVLSRGAQDRTVSAAEAVTGRLLKWNCFACHERDGVGGVGPRRWSLFETVNHVELGDEGRIPPSLSRVGRKLLVPWMQAVLEGRSQIRFHLVARMPRFGKDNLGDLARQLAAVDIDDSSPQRERRVADRASVQVGRTLLDQGCVQCHPLRGEWLPGVVGVDLAGLDQRLRPEWFRAFLLDPALLKSGTRMPTFFPKGKSLNPELLNGDVERQIASIWDYLKTIRDQPLPEKLVTGKALNFDVVPRDRPIVLRTFMEAAGTHAIAVGFPAQTHLAFDADQVRIVEAWQGSFLNAHGTWFDRFVPPARPLGDQVVRFPEGIPLAPLANDKTAWPVETGAEAGYRFSGYRLDRTGVPSFLYRTPNLRIEDRFVPLTGRAGLSRDLKIVPAGGEVPRSPPIWLRLAIGREIRSSGPDGYRVDDRWTIRLHGSSATVRGQLRSVNEQLEWIVPLTVGTGMTLHVSYQW